ncbi:unnamed protein product [Dibothriocephalus latus]|uniref:Uncharacterized protein n=1 Tax=Dibothriocephalus latus TaxID=60516 RepID=A0A3P7MAU1_DIBLA|nr:unnamed protein product [Dibothriocephalus latus]
MLRPRPGSVSFLEVHWLNASLFQVNDTDLLPPCLFSYPYPSPCRLTCSPASPFLTGEPMYTFKSVANFYDAIPSTPCASPLKAAQPTKTEQLLSQLDNLESRLKRVSEDARSLSKGTQ